MLQTEWEKRRSNKLLSLERRSPKKNAKTPPPEKAAILRLHLLEHTPPSDLCDNDSIHAPMFYRSQKELFENTAPALDPSNPTPQ